MKILPYNIEITSKEQAKRVMLGLLEYGGQLIDTFKYPNNRYRYAVRIMLWEGTEKGFSEIAGVNITPPPIVILEQGIRDEVRQSIEQSLEEHKDIWQQLAEMR